MIPHRRRGRLSFRILGAGICLPAMFVLWNIWADSSSRVVVRAPDGAVWDLAVANTATRRAAGLSGKSRKSTNGLLLIFPAPGAHAIWMHGMAFPLDLLWLDTDGHVLALLTDVPICSTRPCPILEPPPGTHATYVVELPAGEVERAGVRRGNQLSLSFQSVHSR
jgi:uncharacterized membrane protein (UPF0127 family)